MSTTVLAGTAHAPSASSLPAPARGAAALWTGRVITASIALFLVADGALRVAHFAPYVEGLTMFGYPATLATPIGLTLLLSTLLYLLPRTAVLGAVLVTAYLGGAVATHVRVGDGSYLFAVAFGVLAWAGLYLREPRLRALLPLR